MTGFFQRHWRKVAALAALLGAPVVMHSAIVRLTRFDPPGVRLPEAKVERPSDDLRTFGRSYVRRHGKLLEVRLMGTPEEIGYSHAQLLYEEMVKNEGELLGVFSRQVKNPLFRWLLLDVARVRYRDLDQGMSADRLREIRAGSLGFQPDPYRNVFDTYQRFVYLNALYDISLSFEHSPLIGCTTFALHGRAVRGGGALLARNFDMGVNDVFDDKKAVFFVSETGRIPFASVAWPGLVGVVSGMNAEGVAVVVHGARAGEPRASGEPVVHTLRRVLSTARNAAQAVELLRTQEPMVSHIVILADAEGKTASVERVPGRAPYMHWLSERAVITNHFEGGASDDPKDQRVRDVTSTVPRRRRGIQLLGRLKQPITAVDAILLLRDRRGINDLQLPLGDREAIDALIATHGVVFDTARRVLWVSESPHLLGRFVAFDLKKFLSADHDPSSASPLESVPEDPLVGTKEYRDWRDRASQAPAF